LHRCDTWIGHYLARCNQESNGMKWKEGSAIR
jgi:hypothetical protein